MTTHGGCRGYIPAECTFGVLQPIYLPPHGVSIPRTEVPMEAIIGVQIKSKSTPLQRDYSCRKYCLYFISILFSHKRKKKSKLKFKKLKNKSINENSEQKRNEKSLAELRTFGIGETTDSELSIRHLELTPNDSEISFHLTPTVHLLETSRQRKVSKESIDSGCQHEVNTDEANRSDDCDNNLDSLVRRNSRTTKTQKHQTLDINVLKSSSSTLSDMSCSNRTIETECGGKRRSAKKDPKKYHSAKRRHRKDSLIGRSRSFQERDVAKPTPSNVRRCDEQVLRQMDIAMTNDDTISHHNIEITIEDVDQIDSTDDVDLKIKRISKSSAKDRKQRREFDSTSLDSYEIKSERGKARSGHILGRLFRRMRKLSLGWHKSRCKKFNRGEQMTLLLVSFSLLFSSACFAFPFD